MISLHDVDRALAKIATFLNELDPDAMTPEEAADVSETRAALLLLGEAWIEHVRTGCALRAAR